MAAIPPGFPIVPPIVPPAMPAILPGIGVPIPPAIPGFPIPPVPVNPVAPVPVPLPPVLGPGLPAAGIPGDLHQIFTIIGLTPDKMTRFMDIEHFTTIADFGIYNTAEIARMVSDYSRLVAARCIIFGLNCTKKLQAIVFWVRKQLRMGHMIDALAITPATNLNDITELNLETSDEAVKSMDKLYPGKFTPLSFCTWTEGMPNFLSSIRGESGIPTVYVIRDANINPNTARDPAELMILSAPHAGPAYVADNRIVYSYLKNSLLGTEGWAWFQEAPEGNGRQAWLNLTTHYNGPTELRRRAAEAITRLEQIIYKSETQFPFEKYATRLKECFRDLEEAGQAWTEWSKVQQLIAGVQSTDPRVPPILVFSSSLYGDNFSAACSYIASQIVVFFARSLDSKRKISALYAGYPPQNDEQITNN